MRGVFRLAQTITSVTTAEPLLYIATPADLMIEILSARVTCENEDTSEQIKISLNRIASGSVGGGTALTAKPTEPGGAVSTASGCTCKGGDTAITSLTSDSINDAIASGGANKLGGWEYVPLPEERHIITVSDELVLETIDTIANSCDLTAEIIFREIG